MAKDLTQALHEATLNAQGQTSRENTKLPAAKPVAAIPARSGVGMPPSGGSGGGSIAGPLTETSYAARTWWPDRSLESSDGIFSLKIKPIKTVTMQDGNAATLVMSYAQPT